MTAPLDEETPERPDDGAAAPAVPAQPTRMLPSEQQFGYLLAAALAGVTLASHVSAAAGGDGKSSALIAVGIAMAAVMAAGVRYGQRVITSFTAVIAGFAPLAKSYVGVSFLCLIYGGWLMWKASRAQQKARAAGLVPPPRARRRKEAAPARGRSDEGTAATGSRRPAANRRYTPPKGKRGAGRRS